MIIGVVNARREATIRLIVHGADALHNEIEFIIDTGFSGFLTLPPRVIAGLGLTWQARTTVMLGDGALHTCDVYAGAVMWDGSEHVVEVESAETDPLVGMALLRDQRLEIEVVVGGRVTIQALS